MGVERAKRRVGSRNNLLQTIETIVSPREIEEFDVTFPSRFPGRFHHPSFKKKRQISPGTFFSSSEKGVCKILLDGQEEVPLDIADLSACTSGDRLALDSKGVLQKQTQKKETLFRNAKDSLSQTHKHVLWMVAKSCTSWYIRFIYVYPLTNPLNCSRVSLFHLSVANGFSEISQPSTFPVPCGYPMVPLKIIH